MGRCPRARLGRLSVILCIANLMPLISFDSLHGDHCTRTLALGMNITTFLDLFPAINPLYSLIILRSSSFFLSVFWIRFVL